MSEQPISDIEFDDLDDDEDCWECGGEGGFNSCMEDCCPAIGGEDGCDDPVCWRVCPNCRGQYRPSMTVGRPG